MPDLTQILNEIKHFEDEGSSIDKVRRKYIKNFSELRRRNTIVYYSGWLQNPNLPESSISDMDIDGFMTNLHQMDKNKGLDLILHTPGGDIAATENIVNYLREYFSCDIEAFVPQIAMSAGTMLACSCRKIHMGKQSSLGPIDPQFYVPNIGHVPALGIIEERDRGIQEIAQNPASQFFWAHIFQKYTPTLLEKCEKAIAWSEEITTNWLQDCMFKDLPEDQARERAKGVVDKIASHKETKSHSRHLSAQKCKEIGLIIENLEDNQEVQDAVLSVHHACMATLQNPSVIKIIENQSEKIFITRVATAD